MTKRALPVAFLAACFGSTADAQTFAIYDTFGPGNSFDLVFGWAITPTWTQGAGFVARATGKAVQLDIAMAHISGEAWVDLRLFADNGSNFPGALLGAIAVPLNPQSYGTPLAFVSYDLTNESWNFVAGRKYWLIASSRPQSELAWMWNDQNIRGDWFQNRNILDRTHGAFRIEAVPEPASLLALGAGLTALLARRRRSA